MCAGGKIGAGVGVVLSLAVGISALADDSCESDRVLSFDRRVGKIFPAECTGFLIDVNGPGLISNEHCAPIDSVGFFVTRPPPDFDTTIHPSHEYPVEPASVQSGGTGSGQDWYYARLLPNPITGLTAVEAMGDALSMADKMPHLDDSGDGLPVRITGHGVYGEDPPTNGMQRTGVGVYTRYYPGLAGYNINVDETETRGGSSGSPVIELSTGLVYGIHYGAGACRDGHFSGRDAVAADSPALRAALCNIRGILTEVPDCNFNAVIDACDVNPEDPDLNGSVSPDCNGNGVPDECELPSLDPDASDCDQNDVPDECDADCQPNGVPDYCDIAGGFSQDLNANGSPDECECQIGDPCDDALSCTTDVCDSVTLLCSHVTDPSYCLIEGVCHTDGTGNPGSYCQKCDATRDQSAWSFEDDGTVCPDDGLFCTGPEACVDGVCRSAGNPCLLYGLVCEESTDLCVSCQGGSECDDGRECTVDVCDGGTCAWTNVLHPTPCGDQSQTECDLPDICTGSGICHANTLPAGTPCTDDGVYCNGTEICTDGTCASPGDPCPAGFVCNEAFDVCECDGDDDCPAGYACLQDECGSGRFRCALDCNNNGSADSCDIYYQTSTDINLNDIPDECDPFPCELTKLTSADAAEGDLFGSAVAISNDFAIVGAYRDDDACPENPNCNSGSALLYERSGSDWREVGKLTDPSGAPGDAFGAAVAISDDIVVVGAANADEACAGCGAAYVFRRNAPDVWELEATLTASDAGMGLGDNFGTSVAVDGERIVVGASLNDEDGSAYVFAYDTEYGWQETSKLVPGDLSSLARFGSAVSISGDWIVVGAPSMNLPDPCGNAGAAYVFGRSGTVWVLVQKLTALDDAGEDDCSENDHFGSAVSIDGDTVVVGAKDKDRDAVNPNSGAAYVYQRDGMTWNIEKKLTASDFTGGDWFGYSVSVDRGLIIVGARRADSSRGSAYVFQKQGETWVEADRLTAGDAAEDDRFGEAVAISNDFAIVGAYRDDDACPGDPDCNSGSAYVYRVTLGTDFNNDMVPDDCESVLVDAGPPYDFRKNRYIAFSPNNTNSMMIQVQVIPLTCDNSGKVCSYDEDCPDFASGERCRTSQGNDPANPDPAVDAEWETIGWVGAPCVITPGTQVPADTYASLVVRDMPPVPGYFYVDPCTGDSLSTLFVQDCEIMPRFTYGLRATGDGTAFTSRLIIGTILEPYKNAKNWADVVGQRDPGTGEYTPPNERINVDDVSVMIVFLNNKSYRPHITVLDLSHEVPDYKISADDLQMVLRAFSETEDYPPLKLQREASGAVHPRGCPDDAVDATHAKCDTPCPEGRGSGGGGSGGEGGGGPPGMPGGGGPSGPESGGVPFLLVAEPDLIEPDDVVDVDVYVGAVPDLGGFEFALVVSGGDTGELVLEEVIIEKFCIGGPNDGLPCTQGGDCPDSGICLPRSDYVFGSSATQVAGNETTGSLVNVMNSGGVEVETTAYLGTFRYRASQDASGVFTVGLLGGEDSLLLDSSALNIVADTSDTVDVGCDVECLDAGDCDDEDPCTTDTCESNICVYDDAPVGTPCTDDGNDCTDDECDGNGLCTHPNKASGTTCTDDGSWCTDDECDGNGVCTHPAKASGTPCNDGLYCTETDECDGSGTCVGTGNPCSRRFPKCCEPTQECVLPFELCPW